MVLTKLELKNFRSYFKSDFEFYSTITIIIGPNTSGKTNLLEAIFLLSTGKSFRAELDREMVKYDAEVARVSARITNNLTLSSEDIEVKKIEIVLTQGAVMGRQTRIKKFLVNEVPKRYLDFVGNLKVVLFWPEDLELVTDSPSLRRKYLDFVLVQVDREYRRSLASYEKGVRQRNKILDKIREGVANRNQLLFWNQLLIKTGSYLTKAREKFIDSVNSSEQLFQRFRISYSGSVISETRLKEYAEAEVASASTLVGPHRDDLIFFEKDRDLSKYGSRGEQRLMILWLKLAELKYIEATTEERPVLLLDDIFSELDHEHRDEVVKIVGNQQTILTTTDIHFLPKNLVSKAKMIELQ